MKFVYRCKKIQDAQISASNGHKHAAKFYNNPVFQNSIILTIKRCLSKCTNSVLKFILSLNSPR